MEQTQCQPDLNIFVFILHKLRLDTDRFLIYLNQKHRFDSRRLLRNSAPRTSKHIVNQPLNKFELKLQISSLEAQEDTDIFADIIRKPIDVVKRLVNIKLPEWKKNK